MLLILVMLLLGFCLSKQLFKLSCGVLLGAASIIVGALAAGTSLYILDVLMVRSHLDRSVGDAVFLIAAIVYIYWRLKTDRPWRVGSAGWRNLRKDKGVILLSVIFLLYSIWMNYHTFSVSSGMITVRGGAWSDILYHNAYARTVSLGSNVPTTYPYYANSQIHYHFMFDYLAGKLAQSGWNSVHALNFLSALGMFALLLLLFEFGRRYFKSKAVGVLTAVFLILHSSLAAIRWLFSEGHPLNRWVGNPDIAFESWGLFNFNVFINQRHFAFSLAVCVLVVLLVLVKREQATVEWRRELVMNLPLVLLIALLPYWNVIMSVACILFVGAFGVLEIGRNRRLAVILMGVAVLAAAICLPQIHSFSSGESVLSGYPKLHIGYDAGKGVIKIFDYYFNVLGYKLLLIIAAFFIVERRKRIELLVFLLPFLAANVVQLGKVLYDNNKLMFISLMFANAYAADLLVQLFNGGKQQMRLLSRAVACVLLLSSILGGLVDFGVLTRLSTVEIKDDSSTFKQWLVADTPKSSVLMTSGFIPYGDNATTAISLAGRMLYCVRNNVDAAVDVSGRLETIRKVYSFAEGPAATIALLKREKVDYLVVDSLSKNNEAIVVNRQAIKDNLKRVYFGANEYEGVNLEVYQVE